MHAHSQDTLREATRLTREGRLAEAAALLQRLARGEAPAAGGRPPPPPPRGGGGGGGPGRRPPRPGGAPPAAGGGAPPAQGAPRQPRVFDVDPATGEAQPPFPQGAPFGRHGAPEMPEAVRDLLARLNRGGLAPGRAPPPAPWPEGARFVAGSFGNAAGSRGYKLYIPARRAVGPTPLVVMLHGCTQSPDDFAAGTRMNALAEEEGCLVVYPGQTQAANAQKCWNWFNPADQRREGGEPALIAGITREVMRAQAVDPARVYVAGLSAGGAAAAIMARAYPDLYAAVGVHSGLACGAARDMPSAFAAMRQGGPAAQGPQGGPGGRIVPTIVFHADKDATVHPRNGDQVIAQSGGGRLRVVVERGQVPGGHGYSRTVHADASGRAMLEQWVVHGGGHAWSGGSRDGTYTDPLGPDASREMLRFFGEHRLAEIGG